MEINIGKENKPLSTPIAIVFAGILIAGAVLYNGSKDTAVNRVEAAPTQQNKAVFAKGTPLDKIKPISADDHIRGSKDAQVFIVEYSDTECPFCKRFHETMKQAMVEYGGSGKVAWVYRHFPLDQLHSKARGESIALECAGELGGNEKFWAYADRLYEVTPSNNGLDPLELPKIASYVGLDAVKFNACLTSGKYDAKIEADSKNAADTGGNGTPWSIIVAKNGKKLPINGAQQYASVKQNIETALKEK